MQCNELNARELQLLVECQFANVGCHTIRVFALLYQSAPPTSNNQRTRRRETYTEWWDDSNQAVVHKMMQRVLDNLNVLLNVHTINYQLHMCVCVCVCVCVNSAHTILPAFAICATLCMPSIRGTMNCNDKSQSRVTGISGTTTIGT
jgi:hypothetical protein